MCLSQLQRRQREKLLCIYTEIMYDAQKVQSMGSAAGNSMRAVPEALQYLAKVVVQDALERAEKAPENRVHAFLLEMPEFQ